MTTEATTTERPSRRRASRAAGPTADTAAAVTSMAVESAPKPEPAPAKALRPPPRRAGNRRRVAIIGLVAVALLGSVAGGAVAWLAVQHKDITAQQDRDQRFIDTAKQTVVNMFSFTPDNIDQSVNRFVGDTSGPLRDMLSQNNNVENLKAMFRDTNASSEAVINGAALEAVDNVSNNASVLVAVRVTVTDMQGVNKPSQPYRMRVIVHEDDNGRMTGYDLKYPDGGN
ncbi:Mce-associated membrane protein [Mycolicibacterium sp. BK556]|uniref:mammalian cell entry protein n=1 Tax=Mycobacteriaceae TaxID=1762 RepID=UPI00105B546E|nr:MULTISPECIES: mammalian cell entry protein [Mycobacteriaceae]MBB3601708.1 Mce-associated membrane protein [Mycolicibacterium sp. BK556]MBB3631460.1 Mce-associated membrane protein [Mycolicibacterium sp. BK607]MBB3749464.1 Mce-associated membrane protein [Mycolicibacterium sp. BK634]TDO14317.1 Mce-associated membrane protein [Mycobacterium sp. BK086]